MAAITIASGSRRDVTAFDYRSLILFDQQDTLGGVTVIRKDGGDVLPFVVGATLPVWGDIVGIDTSAANQVIQQGTSNGARRIGVCVGQLANGRGVFGPNSLTQDWGGGVLKAGGTIFVQVNGVAIVKADGAASIGDLLVPSTTTAGQVHANNAPGTGLTVGRALSAAVTAGDQIYMFLPS